MASLRRGLAALLKRRTLLAVVLLAAGTLALVYRDFRYDGETHEAKLGPLEFRVTERERVEIPPWVGVAAIAAGAAILLRRP